MDTHRVDLRDRFRLSSPYRLYTYILVRIALNGVTGDGAEQCACHYFCGVKKFAISTWSASVFTFVQRSTHTATTGPSAILISSAPSALRPSHFRLRFFFALALGSFSPPPPSHNRPSAVLTARRAVDDIADDNTKGGESEIPDDCAGAAIEGYDVRIYVTRR